jgi:hypothetical protein
MTMPSETSRFVKNVLLWLVPAFLIWFALTPLYNRFLQISTENLLNLFESPDVTRLVPQETHTAIVSRIDFPSGRSAVGKVRTTDLHFPNVLLFALFLAVPGLAWKERLSNLGMALLVSVIFHLVLHVFWVKFIYATQLGDWSLQNYGAFSRNFWGLGKHLMDLPIKLGLPFGLWAAYYLGRFAPMGRDQRSAA